MLNAVSSGRRFVNVTPVRSGGSISNRGGSRWPQATRARPAVTRSAGRPADRASVGLAGRISTLVVAPGRIGDATGGPGGEAPRGGGGSLSWGRTAGATGRRSPFIPAAVTTAGAR